MKYLCQSNDGRQKWKTGPKEYNFYWVKLVKEYWLNDAEKGQQGPDDELDDSYSGEARGMNQPDFPDDQAGP